MKNESILEKIEQLNYNYVFKNKVKAEFLEKHFDLIKREYKELNKNTELRAEHFTLYPELKTYFKNLDSICEYKYEIKEEFYKKELFKKISCVKDPTNPDFYIIYKWEDGSKLSEFNSNLISDHTNRYHEKKNFSISYKGISDKKLESYLIQNNYTYKDFLEKNADIYDQIELNLV